jgi:hypothetical protein
MQRFLPIIFAEGSSRPKERSCLRFKCSSVHELGRKGDFDTVPSRSHENKSCLKTGNKPENDDPGLLEEGEMEQVGRLI